MDLLRDILRRYGTNLVAIGVFACAAVSYCRLNDAFDLNRHLEMIALAFGGLVAFIASEEWSDWTGQYGLSRQQWFSTPAWIVRVIGGIMLVYYTIVLFRQ
jgi:hypothetical protein